MQMLCELWCSRESRDASGHAHVLIESTQPSSTSAEPGIPHALLWLLRVRTAGWRLWTTASHASVARACRSSRAAKRRRDAEEEAAAAQALEDKQSRYELAREKANRAAALARQGPGATAASDDDAIGADDEDEQLQRNLLKVSLALGPSQPFTCTCTHLQRMMQRMMQPHSCPLHVVAADQQARQNLC